MKKTALLKRFAALAMASTMFLSACGTGGNETPPESPAQSAPAPDAGEDPANEPAAGADASKYTVEEKSDGTTSFYLVTNPNDGATLSYSKDGGVELLEVEEDGTVYAFKDMNKNGTLEDWEDWRNDYDARALSVSADLSKEQIAGLMLFSSHVFTLEGGITEDQKTFLKDDELRNVLNAAGNDVEQAVTWNNQMQAYVESIAEPGKPIIPVNISSDPRNTANEGDQKDAADISRWPSNLGLAATFDPETTKQFADMAAQEYRAMGITTALGPQIDVATEPRWMRVSGTFGEDAGLTTEMTRAYGDGSQSTWADGEDQGWGMQSVVVMTKHFPGDGSGEAGRESHTEAGKYAIFPGNNFESEVSAFIDGGLHLAGKTGQSASFMTDYSVLLGADGEALTGERVATAYNKPLIDKIRVENNYEGVLCTDWGVTGDYVPGTYMDLAGFGMSYGVEDLSVGERHYRVLQSGMDMFGGNNDKGPVLEAYDLWKADHEAGKVDISADERFAQTGYRVVRLIMQTGIFEHPFLDMDTSKATIASADKVEAGYQAQLDSIVLLKNAGGVIKAADVEKDYQEMVVYIPQTFDSGSIFHSPFGPTEDTFGPSMNIDIAKTYFKEVVTDTEVKDADGNITGYEAPDLSGVDMVIVGMRSPNNGTAFSRAGYNADLKWYPLSLQYRPYTADGPNVRKESISGDILEDGSKQNRSYFGETSIISNEYDLDACLNAIEAVEASGKDIPVVVALKATTPIIPAEFEGQVDAIVVGFSTSDQALFDMILGKQDFKGLLPIQFPKDMDTVEKQLEDVGRDMDPYVDADGNSYDFAYGLNYAGVIQDARVEAYSK